MHRVLVLLLVSGAVLLQQGAAQGHRQGPRGDTRRAYQGEDAADFRIHFQVDDGDDRRGAQRRDDMVYRDGSREISVDNRNFIFAPSFKTTAAPCPRGAFKISKTSPCRYSVRDSGPRSPVRPEGGACPRGMQKVGAWCREPYR